MVRDEINMPKPKPKRAIKTISTGNKTKKILGFAWEATSVKKTK